MPPQSQTEEVDACTRAARAATAASLARRSPPSLPRPSHSGGERTFIYMEIPSVASLARPARFLHSE